VNERTKRLTIISTLLLSIAIGYRVYDASVSDEILDVKVNQMQPIHALQNKEKRAVKLPERGYITESIDSLARQIIEDAPNKDEAFGFLVESEAFRIQELRKKRIQERAKEEKARYDAEYWNKKRKHIDRDLTKGEKTPKISNDQNENNFERINGGFIRPLKKNNSGLNGFVLRAIIKEGTHYIARLSYKNQYIPAKEGYTLQENVTVVSIRSDQVILKKGTKTITLYTY
jgi:hypothetical protein